MTKIDFYILPDNEPDTLFNCVYKLAQKIMKTRQLLYIQAQGHLQCETLCQNLWHKTPETFMPNHYYQQTDEAFNNSWIGIGTALAPRDYHHILINLSGTIPGNFSRFLRLLEIVPADHQARKNSREAYGYYKDRGYELNVHNLV